MECYYNSRVISMSAKVDKLLQELQSFTVEEIKEFLIKAVAIFDRLELLGWLRTAEPAFSDWDNEEDACYDEL